MRCAGRADGRRGLCWVVGVALFLLCFWYCFAIRRDSSVRPRRAAPRRRRAGQSWLSQVTCSAQADTCPPGSCSVAARRLRLRACPTVRTSASCVAALRGGGTGSGSGGEAGERAAAGDESSASLPAEVPAAALPPLSRARALTPVSCVCPERPRPQPSRRAARARPRRGSAGCSRGSRDDPGS